MGSRLLVVGLVMIVCGAVCLALGYSAQRRDGVLKSWPSVAGKVISCSVVRTVQDRLHSSVTRASTPPDPKYSHDPVWAIATEYEYSARGKPLRGYEATSALLVEDIIDRASAPGARMQSLAAQLAPGTELNIHYNPADPRQSYAIYIDTPGKERLYRAGGICAAIGLLLSAVAKLA